MTTTLWRVIDAAFADDPLSTIGAFRFPGRWHSAGFDVLYTAETESLARAEKFVHVAQETGLDFVLLELRLPDRSVIDRFEDVPVETADWSAPTSASGRAVGDWWRDHSSSLGLAVPSVLSTSERTVLLRRASPFFGRIKIVRQVPFRYDPRMFEPLVQQM